MTEPGLEPPPGVKSNFDNPVKTVYTASIATQVLCISIVGVIVAVRVYTRTHILCSFGLDDWLLVFGFLFAVGYSAIALTMNHYGGGLNQWDVPKEKLEPFGITVYSTMVIYGPCAFCIKASILVFLTRVFAPIRRAVMLIYLIIGFLFAYYLPVLGLKAAICRPVAKFWDDNLPGQCFDQRALILADSVVSVVSDVIIFAAPLPLTCNLQMKKMKRVKVAAVFSAGGLACICSAIRLIDIVQNGLSPNQTLVFMRVNLWGIAEVYIGLITACMPLLPAFYKHHFGTELPTGYSHHHYSNNERSIEMLSSRHNRKRNTTMAHKSPDSESDENVLIVDMISSNNGREGGRRGSMQPSSNQNSSRDRSLSPVHLAVSPKDDAQIMKTVEIQQTYQ
ncbi:hypothetical protein BDV95DRAFT_391473 [Massariosphaeria phaeospora]|uniref:Rhodopsin domain-containing protein n=1 Tax=Massariosphaeria phaeospora TaxID=100035 RepID=A0A7C8MM91_9PLEO|nr:hypothetical protein BDV95DRAFT_391473 [Massariosphaeria phaeospora]